MEIEYKLTNGNTLKIIQDEDAMDPRTEMDNLSKMVCFHPRYDLGDKHDYNQKDYGSWNELKVDIIKKEEPAVILPLYLYDHSGITIRTTPFSCQWDSMVVGFVFITRKTALEEYGMKRMTKAYKERLTKYMLGEVETYDQYLTGDVYGFVVEDPEGEEIDSCWGFYGSDPLENGILDQAGIEVTELINYKL